jgi:hypothetical protein
MLDAQSAVGALDVQARFGGPFQAFMLLLHDALAAPETQERVSARYAEYASAVEEALRGSGSMEGVTEAYESCLAAMQEAMAETRVADRAPTAFREYVRALRNAWADVEPDAVDPIQLVAIAQSMSSVGWLAAAAMHAPETAPRATSLKPADSPVLDPFAAPEPFTLGAPERAAPPAAEPEPELPAAEPEPEPTDDFSFTPFRLDT